jgi:hypothetical protein
MHEAMRSSRMLRTLAAAAFLLAAPLHAQEASLAPSPSTDRPTADSTVAAGPTRDAASVAVRRATEAPASVTAAAAAGGHSRGEALMIVGGAAILTGIVVGGDAGHAISIAGAVIGLYGLYQYLQ